MTRLGARLWGSPYVLLAIAAFCWASNSVIGKAVSHQIPPITFSFWRWTLAAAVMTALAAPRIAGERDAIARNIGRIALLGVLGIAGFSVLLYYGLARTTALNGLLVQAVQPCLTMMAVALLHKERPSTRAVAGILVSLAGVAVIVTEGAPGRLIAAVPNSGDLLILGATVLYAFYTILVARSPVGDPLVAAAAIFIAGALWLAPAYAVEHGSGARMALTPATLAAIAYCALFASCLAYVAYNRTVALIGPTRAGSVTNLMPVFGTLLATTTLGEQLRGYHLVGIALVVAGVAVVRRGSRNDATAEACEQELTGQ